MANTDPGGSSVAGRGGTPSRLLVLAPFLFIIVLAAATLPYLFSTASMPDMQGAECGDVAAAASGKVGGPFSLIDQDGRPVTQQSWPGKYLLVYFGYTHCPAVCPTTLYNLGVALDGLGRAADRIQPLFISVDPGRDSAALLKDYVAQFSPRLDGLTGSEGAVAAAAGHYRISYRRQRTGPGPDDYAMDHTSILYLMNPDGSLAAAIPADGKPAALASAIRARLR